MFAGGSALRIVSIMVFFLVWEIGSLTLGQRLCPDPLRVLAFAGREIAKRACGYEFRGECDAC